MVGAVSAHQAVVERLRRGGEPEEEQGGWGAHRRDVGGRCGLHAPCHGQQSRQSGNDNVI